MRNFNRCQFEPKATNSDISNDDLKKLLSLPKKKHSLFCWHDWIVWQYGGVSKLHRVCKKCHKKQMSNEVVTHGNVKWVKEYNIK